MIGHVVVGAVHPLVGQAAVAAYERDIATVAYCSLSRQPTNANHFESDRKPAKKLESDPDELRSLCLDFLAQPSITLSKRRNQALL